MAARVRFGLLVAMFQAMSRDRTSAKKRGRLRVFLDRAYGPSGRDDYFSALRLVLPGLDRERGSYGLKEAALAAVLVDALGIAKDSPDAVKLINWRRGGGFRNAGNFALVAAEVLQRRQGMTSGGLTIKEVNDALDRLAATENRQLMVYLLAEEESGMVTAETQIELFEKALRAGKRRVLKQAHPPEYSSKEGAPLMRPKMIGNPGAPLMRPKMIGNPLSMCALRSQGHHPGHMVFKQGYHPEHSSKHGVQLMRTVTMSNPLRGQHQPGHLVLKQRHDPEHSSKHAEKQLTFHESRRDTAHPGNESKRRRTTGNFGDDPSSSFRAPHLVPINEGTNIKSAGASEIPAKF